MSGSWDSKYSMPSPAIANPPFPIRTEEPLWKHTTFKIGGPADFYAEVGTLTELSVALSWAREKKLPVFVIGWGSNILVQDGGIRGLVLRLRKVFEKVEWTPPWVYAGAGTHLPRLAKMSVSHGLTGLEPLVGIPGTVGGALISNAGTPRGEIGPTVERVDYVDWTGRPQSLEKPDLEFSYRSSNLSNRGVLTGAFLCLKPEGKNVIIRRIQEELSWRSQTQPVGTYNVGSIFRNPPGDFAGRLVEAVGLKGFKVGNAQFSLRHANFIVNSNRAPSHDVLSLIEQARARVADRFGIKLELEIKVVGEAK